jgi:hypothetical protein
MPLTGFQRRLLAELASTPNDHRYLAGGAAMHFAPNSVRYSDDLDFFHDSEELVASTFASDRNHLAEAGYLVQVQLSQPGFIRAVVKLGDEATRVDWARDSAWRFMPLERDLLGGWLLHPIDLAINKVLTLAGRDEPRDFVDMLFAHERILALAALTWAAVGKDPGFTPLSLLELLKRRGRYNPEDFKRLHLASPFDLNEAKMIWLTALEQAEIFARDRPAEEVGCLYYHMQEKRFVLPRSEVSLAQQGIVTHFGVRGGVLPRLTDES